MGSTPCADRVEMVGNLTGMSFVPPPPDLHKLQIAWEEWERGEQPPGKVLANRAFVNMPRTIARQELYEVTALGSPVKYLTVFNWIAGQSRSGFSATQNAAPLITVVERQ